MQLPPSLQPWRLWLDWFSPDLTPAIGNLLLRLNPLVGQYRTETSMGIHEPDGISDLRRRGSYERLLISEWAVADAAPDEFFRRAATGEHLFLAVGEKVRKAERRTIALFDVGPLQLGAPRLAHIALWILLARRAAEMNARFAWGVTQAPGELFDADSPDMLKRLLHARSLTTASPKHWQEWLTWATTQSQTTGEWWDVGQSDVESLISTHQFSAKRALSEDAIEVTLQQRDRKRVLSLPLPDEEPSLRLLRGEFLMKANPSAHQVHGDKFSLKQPPLITSNGRYVAAALLSFGAHVFSIPESPDKRSKHHRHCKWSVHGSFVAGAMSGKKFGGLVGTDSHLFFWQLDGFNAIPRPPPERFSAPPGLAHWLPCFWIKADDAHRVYVLDTLGNLVFWVNRKAGADMQQWPGSTYTLAQQVIGVAQVDQNFIVYARAENTQLWVEVINPRGVSEHTYMIPLRSAPIRAYFSGGSRWLSKRGNWAVETTTDEDSNQGGQRWRLYEGVGNIGDFISREVELPSNWEVYGLIRDIAASEPKPALVALKADRKSLILISASGVEPLYVAADRISAMSVSAGSNLLAMVTEDRRLTVFSPAHRTIMLSVMSGEE